MSKPSGIVVGVDESDHAQRALGWALEEARLRQVRVTVLHAWDYNYYPAGVYVQVGNLEDERRSMVDRAVEPWREEYADIFIDIRLVRMSSGAAALEQASGDADLVVVGSRGRGGLVGLLLGSVSGEIVQVAHCPVVVVGAEQQ